MMECVILAGGMGTRLRSVVADVPKCMATVAGKPFLEYIISSLENAGFDHIVLSLGYKHEYIEQWLENLNTTAKISFVVEDTPLGTGGAVRYALTKAEGENVFVLNGDTFFQVNYKEMLSCHLSSGAEATLALKKMYNFSRYGAVETDGKSPSTAINSFREKQYCDKGYINGGVYIIGKSHLDKFPEVFSLEKEYFEAIVTRQDSPVRGYISDGYFIDIGIPEDFAKAQDDFKYGRYKPFDTLFLDRDGVINVLREGDYVKNVGEFQFIDGAVEALKMLSGLFSKIIIITNQRGVGKGLMTLRDLEDVHNYMIGEITKAGGRIDRVYVCTDLDEESPNRKPNIGMALQARKDYPDIDLDKSIFAGDSDSDMQFAQNAGIPAVRIDRKVNLLTFARQLQNL
ncbi:MAG: HAD-IIIA family hydrolase [Bacteroidales bacterium]|nr:HAD-IIIA family hydrolase [Bacteroidales bacterium]MDD4670560.1 HAD-IIIA family hydrolase [Bacteroidales bacterium]